MKLFWSKITKKMFKLCFWVELVLSYHRFYSIFGPAGKEKKMWQLLMDSLAVRIFLQGQKFWRLSVE